MYVSVYKHLISYVLTLNSWPTALYLIPEQSLCHSYSLGHITVFLCLGTLDSTSGGPILNSEINIKSTKMKKNMALRRMWKGHLFIGWELKQEGRVSPCLPQLGMFALGNPNVSLLCMCLSDCESAVSTDFGVIDILASGWIHKNGICEYCLFIDL